VDKFRNPQAYTSSTSQASSHIVEPSRSTSGSWKVTESGRCRTDLQPDTPNPKGELVALYAVTLSDQTTDFVEDADAYQQEGPLTTFFAFTNERAVIDSWSVRLASYRTSEISAIRRSVGAAASLMATAATGCDVAGSIADGIAAGEVSLAG